MVNSFSYRFSRLYFYSFRITWAKVNDHINVRTSCPYSLSVSSLSDCVAL